jgi:hypothetical protein
MTKTNSNLLKDSIIIQSLQYNGSKFAFQYYNNKLSSFILSHPLLGNDAKIIVSYDSIDNIESYVTQRWSYLWADFSRDTYTYDSSGNIIVDLNEGKSDTGWINFIRWNYNYNENRQCLSKLAETWDDSGWVNNYRTNCYYNLAGNLDSVRIDIWDYNKWENNVINVYNFYNNGNTKSQTMKIWDGSMWINNVYNYFTYDLKGNIDTTINQIWDGNNWQNNQRFIYSYDSNNCYVNGRSEWFTNPDWTSGDAMFVNNMFNDFNIGCLGTEQTNYYHKIDGIQENKPTLIGFQLSQNYPNPFNPTTTINYSLPQAGNVKLTVYNILGGKVATIVNEYKPAGNYSVQFNGSNLASGIYLYRLESGIFSETKKFILLK